MKKIIKKFMIGILFVFIVGIAIPQGLQMPVEGASNSDFNKDTFWYHPWGRSGTHKGIDVFAKKGTNLKSATTGLVLFTGTISMGGQVVVVLGPKWRLHYYAHLDEICKGIFSPVTKNSIIGKVGDSGNAAGKQAHLHYSIVTMIPYPWRIDSSPQGWKKAFFLNPIDYL